MWTEFKNKELLRDTYIGIASLRSAWRSIIGHLHELIAIRIDVRDQALSAPEVDRLYELWTTVGVEPELAKVHTEELQLKWAGAG